MPVRVDIPTRLIVDSRSVVTRSGCIEDALTTAAERAILNSIDTVLDARGEYVGVQVHLPTFTWRGARAGEVSADTRANVEGMLINVLGRSIEATGRLRPSRAPGTSPAIPASEPIDADRWYPAFGMYTVRSYDEDGDVVVLDLEDGLRTDVGTGSVVGHTWLPYDEAHLKEALDESLAFWGPIESGRSFGLMALSGGLLSFYFWSREGRHIHDSDSLGGAIGGRSPEGFRVDPNSTSLELDPATGAWQSKHQFLAPGRGRITHYASKADGPDWLRKAYKRFYGPGAREALRSVKSPLVADALELAVNKLIDELVAGASGGSPAHMYVIEIGRSRGPYFRTDSEKNWPDLDASLIPVSEEAEVDESARGGGAGADGKKRKPGRGKGKGRSKKGTGDAEGELPEHVPPPDASAETGGRCYPVPLLQHPTADRSYFGGPDGQFDPFLYEPPLEFLGEDREYLKSLMKEIASRLKMFSTGRYAGRFCVNAAEEISAQARNVTDKVQESDKGISRSTPAKTGNLGIIEFEPTKTQAMQYLCDLAEVVPLVTALSDRVTAIYRKPEHCNKLGSWYTGEPIKWELHFWMEMSPLLKYATGWLFIYAGQVSLMQLLQTSRYELSRRRDNIKTYAADFHRVLLPHLTNVRNLIDLRDRLKDAINRDKLRRIGTYYGDGTWDTERKRFAVPLPSSDVERGIRIRGEDLRIEDEEGRLWDTKTLEIAIALSRGLLEDVDPLIKQFAELDEVLDRFARLENYSRIALAKEPGYGVEWGLRLELEKLLTSNAEVFEDVKGDAKYVIDKGSIVKNIPTATIPGGRFALQGIHLIAHNQIGPCFRGNRIYPHGVDFVLGAEAGFRSLTGFAEFTGVAVLSILCPPLGAAVGIGLAINDYMGALDKEELFEAIIDPEVVISRAEVEAGLFAAKLGLALSFIPELPAVLRTGTTVARAIAKKGTREGLKLTGRIVKRRITRQVAANLRDGFARAYAKELAVDFAMDQFVQLLLEDVIRDIMTWETTAKGTVGGLSGAIPIIKRISERPEGAR